MPTFQFPKENQDAYLGVATFRRIIYTPPDFIPSGFKFSRGPGGISGLLGNFTEEGAVETASTPEPEGDEVTSGPDDGLRGSTSEPTDLEDPNLEDEVVTAASEDVDYATGVKLYMPASITINDGVSYESLDLGPIGAIAESGIRQGQGAMASIKTGFSQAQKSATDLLQGNATAGPAGRLAALRVAEKASPSDISGSVRSGFATAVNPNTRSLFKSVNLREFSFTFTLIANSSSEALEIEKIINFFREELYPSTAVDVNGVSIGYNFPNKFQITFEYNDNQVGTRILPSNLRNVQTVYNPNSMGWHVDGKPSEVQLTLTFGEARTLTKSDIQAGY